jgi:hypothetical protein
VPFSYRRKARRRQVCDELPMSVKDPTPNSVRFDDFEREPDEWQPPWIV